MKRLTLWIIIAAIGVFMTSVPTQARKKKGKRVKARTERIVVYNPNRIVISKRQFRLWVISDGGDTLMNVAVGIGRNPGQKTKTGDMCTPHGDFTIMEIENSKAWTHDFHDGNGEIRGAYGPWFLRLKVPGFNSIGIHGTHAPESRGTRCSEGCIRLLNSDVGRLKSLATVGMRVHIESEREAPVPGM